jgi:hypothetical protein
MFAVDTSNLSYVFADNLIDHRFHVVGDIVRS